MQCCPSLFLLSFLPSFLNSFLPSFLPSFPPLILPTHHSYLSSINSCILPSSSFLLSFLNQFFVSFLLTLFIPSFLFFFISYLRFPSYFSLWHHFQLLASTARFHLFHDPDAFIIHILKCIYYVLIGILMSSSSPSVLCTFRLFHPHHYVRRQKQVNNSSSLSCLPSCRSSCPSTPLLPLLCLSFEFSASVFHHPVHGLLSIGLLFPFLPLLLNSRLHHLCL